MASYELIQFVSFGYLLGRHGGFISSAKWLRIFASIGSVFASLPTARAKSLNWRGLTTATATQPCLIEEPVGAHSLPSPPTRSAPGQAPSVCESGLDASLAVLFRPRLPSRSYGDVRTLPGNVDTNPRLIHVTASYVGVHLALALAGYGLHSVQAVTQVVGSRCGAKC